MIGNTINSSNEALNCAQPVHIRSFASAQYLCSLSYTLPKMNKLNFPADVKMLDQDGKFKTYIVYPLPLKTGMFGYLFLSTDPTERQVKIVFRGTDFSDMNSALINAELGGPGVESFFATKFQLIKFIEEKIHQHFNQLTNLELQVCGHSQGASVAQLFVNEFLARRSEKTSTLFDKITDLTITVLNSPGVPPYIAQQADLLAIRQPLVRDAFKKMPLKITANFGMIGGDPVQVTGLDMIFVRLACEYVKVNLFKLNRKDADGYPLESKFLRNQHIRDGVQLEEIISFFKNAAASALGAHPNINFFSPTREDGLINVDILLEDQHYYTNANADQHTIIKKELLNKLTIPSSVFYFFQECCYNLELGYIKEFIPTTKALTMYEYFKTWLTKEEKAEPAPKITLATLTDAQSTVNLELSQHKSGCHPKLSQSESEGSINTIKIL